MLSSRAETILKSIVGQYIAKAIPVPSQSITDDYDLRVSSATIRNEMAVLEQEGYITRPHPSAGSVPSDRGYRCYVESLGTVKLPLAEQRLVSHLFHQVEERLDEWSHLTATLIAQMVQNVAVVTMPKSEACRFTYLELVSLHNSTVLVVLVLNGAKVREQLIIFDQAVSQAELTVIASKLSAVYSGLTRSQILAKDTELSSKERQIADYLAKIMEDEDNQEYGEPYLDGLYLTLNQPEFTRDRRMGLILMELVEQRNLLRSIIPLKSAGGRVQVIIGRENETEAIRDYSVVISRYGPPDDAVGTIGVIGPTRMPYARTIATIDYLSLVLNGLMAKLYGRETPIEQDPDATDAAD